MSGQVVRSSTPGKLWTAIPNDIKMNMSKIIHSDIVL